VVNIFEAEFLWCGKEKGLVKGGIKKTRRGEENNHNKAACWRYVVTMHHADRCFPFLCGGMMEIGEVAGQV